MLFTPPIKDELDFARAMARKAQPRLGLLLLLKSFQRRGYFPAAEKIPQAIVQHVRMASGMDAEVPPSYVELRTLYRYRQAVRERLGVSAWSKDGLRVASEAIVDADRILTQAKG